MSGNHSHSYSDILTVFREDFNKDFDCCDVVEQLRMILKPKELENILKSEPFEQVYKLFLALGNQDDDVVEKFVLNVSDYDFLMSKIKYEREHPSPDTESYFTAVNSLKNENQKFSKYNVFRIKPYLQLQKALLELVKSKNVVIWGVLGAGKQWLALDVCSSYIVQRKMNFEIYWINVRDCHSAESRLEKLQSFLHQLDQTFSCNSDQSVEIRIERIKTELKHRVEKKSECLIVLRNVQNIETLNDFNIGCKILLTTRHKLVHDHLAKATTTHITLDDSLTPFEVESLFAKYLRNKPHELPEGWNLYSQETNPLKLSFIAEKISEGLGTLDNWQNINNTDLSTYILNSLNILGEVDKKLYEMLFIFPKLAKIPIKLLKKVWEVDDPMKIVNKFNNYSLVEKQDQTISLPSIYLELKLPNTNDSDLNMKIVNSYNIPKLFSQYDDTMTLPHLDCYFYKYIGHHLSNLNDKEERVKLFRMIFLDFRFLDQKIRNDTTPWAARGCILPTLDSLKFYREHIVDNDESYDQLVTALLHFLPKVEEKLIKSQFTSLLQIAMMSKEGPVHNESLRQAQRFPNNVFFTEHGRFHQHRQIINLGKDQVRQAIYLNDDYCLMALNKNQLLLTDVSLQGDTTHVLSDKNDNSDIILMRVFNNEMNLLTLHSNGTLKLWSLRQLLSARDNLYGSRQKVQPLGLESSTKSAYAKESQSFKQLVNNIFNRPRSSNAGHNISAFYLDEIPERRDTVRIQLHVAFVNGEICICDWNEKEEKFQKSCIPFLTTKQHNVRCFAKVLNRFYILCTDRYKLTVWDLQNGSKVIMNDEYAHPTAVAVAMETYIERKNVSQQTVILLIHKDNVWKLSFEHADYSVIKTLEPQALPFYDMCLPPITCSKLSNDKRYLILGTEKGVVVYDLKLSKPVLRSNFSEHIVCVDVFDLMNPIYKYIVLCGAEGKNVVNVHTLQCIEKNSISWVHHEQEDNTINTYAQLEPHVYLRPLLKKSEDGRSLYAVDTKERIHQIQMDVDHDSGRRGSVVNWSIISTPKMQEANHITALCVGKDDTVYTGYNDGVIKNISDNKTLPHVNKERINYLKMINSKILIASDSNYTNIYLLSENNTYNTISISYSTMYAQLFEENYVLLFLDRGVIYFDLRQIHTITLLETLLETLEEFEESVGGFDLRDNILYWASKYGKIMVFRLNVADDKLECHKICNMKHEENECSIINYLTVSIDGELVALGFKNGDIEIYTYRDGDIQFIYHLKQECSNEMKLRFSPCNQILVSCADQLRFWNVKYMQNNQVTPKPRSRRHEHLPSKVFFGREEVDASAYSSDLEQMEHPRRIEMNCGSESKAYLWANKQGFEKRPELLACIGFVGSEARHFYTSNDFSQFYVIDSECGFYHLKVVEQLPEISDHAAINRQLTLRRTNFDRGNDNNGDDAGIDIIDNFDSRPDNSRDKI